MSRRRLDNYLDRGSLETFAGQIVDSVGGVTGVSLHGSEGDLLWSSQTLPTRGWLDQLRDLQRGKARCLELASGCHVYAFALRAADDERLLLSIFVSRLEPLSLAAVFELIGPVLECLERQIALTATLSCRTQIPAGLGSQLELMAAFNDLEPAPTLVESLELLAGLWLDKLDCDAAAIMLPEQQIRVVVPRDAAADRTLVEALGRLITRAKATGRIVLSKQSLGSPRREQTVLSAPVTDSAGRVVGIFAAVGDRLSREHAKLARSSASKVDVLDQQFGSGHSDLLLRDQIIDVVDQSLKRQPSMPLSVLYIDVDKTHLINDSFGYAAGDQAIATIAALLRENAGRDQLVSHLMGDRFAVLLPDADSDAARSRAEHILELLGRESLERDGKTLALSASIGIATAPFAARRGAELLTIAEVAARGAKERGGRQCAIFQSVDASVIQRRSDADQVGYLQMALIENRFVLHAQEIRALDPDATTRKYEVLVRLQDEAIGLIPPTKFLSAAERYQMMAALDRWVIRNTLEAIAGTTSSLDVNLSSFSINVSPQSLCEVDFIEFIEHAIADTSVPPDTLCFELTETAMVRNFEQGQRFIHRLCKRGCRVALDDFGTGYSSFAYLKHLPVQYLKVDGAFVRDILESPLSQSIVSAVVDIAAVMGAATVAEHVENELVLQRLAGLGVRYAQGFHVHRPEPLADVLAELDRSQLTDLFDSDNDSPKVQGLEV